MCDSAEMILHVEQILRRQVPTALAHRMPFRISVHHIKRVVHGGSLRLRLDLVVELTIVCVHEEREEIHAFLKAKY